MTNLTSGSILQLRNFRPAMNDPIILDLITYWEGLRAGRIVPARSDIDPRSIKSALEHTFIVEQVKDGHPRIRLAGMAVCDLLGMELRGMPLRSLIAPPNRDNFDGLLGQVMQTPQITELTLMCEMPHGKIAKARMLLLPLQDHNGKITRVLGCISLQSTLRASPMRFAITDIKQTRIVAGEAIASVQPAAGFAEVAESYRPQASPQFREITGNPNHKKTPTKGGRPNLRLVRDDE